jgi:hypothetical protein
LSHRKKKDEEKETGKEGITTKRKALYSFYSCFKKRVVLRGLFLKGDFSDFFLFTYDIQDCFICRPSDSTVSEDAVIEARAVGTTALAVRRSNHSARSHPQLG